MQSIASILVLETEINIVLEQKGDYAHESTLRREHQKILSAVVDDVHVGACLQEQVIDSFEISFGGTGGVEQGVVATELWTSFYVEKLVELL